MDDLIESPLTIQEKLQLLIQRQPEWWAYAILWKPSSDVNGGFSLSWEDGYFHDRKDSAGGLNIAGKDEIVTSEKPESQDLNYGCLDRDVKDEELFFLVSLTRSFFFGDGLPGKVYSSGETVWLRGGEQLELRNCERAREAQMGGIQTLVCIPTSAGVLEIGSPELIEKKWNLIRQAKSLFGSVLPCVGLAEHGNQTTQIPCFDRYISFSDVGIFAGGGETSNFVTATKEKAPKKCGRRPSHGRKTPLTAVEAERQRREKLSRRFYALQAALPKVLAMDKASLLCNAVSYIDELKTKIQELESQLKIESTEAMDNQSSTTSTNDNSRPSKLEIEVNGFVSDAMISVRSENISHPAARLTVALRELGIQIRHGSLSCINELMLQDMVVEVPDEMIAGDGQNLNETLARRLKELISADNPRLEIKSCI